MKMIEWTKTGGNTHRVTITTDEPCSIMEYQMSRVSTILATQDMDIAVWKDAYLTATGGQARLGATKAHDQRGVLWGIFGSWL